MARGPEGQKTGGSEGQMVRILDGQKVIWPEDYHIHVNAVPLLNRAPGNVKSPVFGVFLE